MVTALTGSSTQDLSAPMAAKELKQFTLEEVAEVRRKSKALRYYLLRLLRRCSITSQMTWYVLSVLNCY